MKTFFILKPDCLERGIEDNVLDFIELNGFKVLDTKVVTPTTKIIKKHYVEHVDKPFFKDLLKYMTRGEVIVGLVEKSGNAVSDFRKLVGATNPSKADVNTVRGMFGIKDQVNGNVENVIHASDSEMSVLREINVWFNEK